MRAGQPGPGHVCLRQRSARRASTVLSPDGKCTATCTCTDDETAVAGGYGWCDETRNTCLPGQDPSGTCPVAPSLLQPRRAELPERSPPQTMIDGCWTGQCQDYAACDIAPEVQATSMTGRTAARAPTATRS